MSAASRSDTRRSDTTRPGKARPDKARSETTRSDARPRRALAPPLRPRPNGPSREEVLASQRKRLFAAVIEASARHGPRRITAEELCVLAGVSKRALYEQFDAGDGAGGRTAVDVCIAATCAAVLDNAARRIRAARRSQPDWRVRIALGTRAACFAVATEPDVARLIMLDVYDAKRVPRKELLAGFQQLETGIGDGLAEDCDTPDPSPLVMKGIVGGIVHVARAHLIAGKERVLPSLAAELAGWAIACCEGARVPAPVKVPENAIPASARPSRARVAAQRRSSTERAIRTLPPSERRGAQAKPSTWAAASGARPADTPASERERRCLIDACVRIACEQGYAAVKVAAVEKAAMLPRGAFHRHFADPDACFLAAHVQCGAEILTAALTAGLAVGAGTLPDRTRAAGGTMSAAQTRTHAGAIAPDRPVGHAVALGFAQALARDPQRARLCLCEALLSGADSVYAQTVTLERFAAKLCDEVAARGHPRARVAASAAAGAIWTVAGHLVANGRIAGLPGTTRVLACLLRAALPTRRRLTRKQERFSA